MASAARVVGHGVPVRQMTAAPLLLASFPPIIPQNPYQRLLYEALAANGWMLVADNRLKCDWLWHERGRVHLLHFHWPQGYYRCEGPRAGVLSWLRLVLFVCRLGFARALGYRIAWTIHQPIPHESDDLRLERVAGRALAHLSDVLIVHDDDTIAHTATELGISRDRLVLVPHGTYRGAYDAGRPRESVRSELGLSSDAFVYLCFGHIRAYKDIELLLEAFARAQLGDVALVIAGMPLDDRVAHVIGEAAARDDRIRALLHFIPDERVAELHAAADVAVIARGDGGTSGAIILALSLGLPVVVADLASYVAQTRNGELGWHFVPGDAASLAGQLEAAARDDGKHAARAAAAAVEVEEDWSAIGRRTNSLFRQATA